MVCSPRAGPSTWSPPAKRRSLTRVSGGGILLSNAERAGKDAPGFLASLPPGFLALVLGKLSSDWRQQQEQQHLQRRQPGPGKMQHHNQSTRAACTSVRLASRWLRDAFDAANERLCLGAPVTQNTAAPATTFPTPDASPEVASPHACQGDCTQLSPWAEGHHAAAYAVPWDEPSCGSPGQGGMAVDVAYDNTRQRQRLLHLLRASHSVCSLVLHPQLDWLSAADVLHACIVPPKPDCRTANPRNPFCITSGNDESCAAPLFSSRADASGNMAQRLQHAAHSTSVRDACAAAALRRLGARSHAIVGSIATTASPSIQACDAPAALSGPTCGVMAAAGLHPSSSGRPSGHACSLPASACAAFKHRRPLLRHLVLSSREDVDDNVLSPVASCTALQHLEAADCGTITCLQPLAACIGLRYLDLSNSHALCDLSPLAACTGLETLLLAGCSSITDIAPLASCTALHRLDLAWCHALETLEPLVACTRLARLGLAGHGSETLDDLPLLANHAPIQTLDIMACESLETLWCLVGCTALQRLDMPCCYSVADIRGLAACTALTHINAAGCASLESPALAPLAALPALQHLSLPTCTGITSLAPLAGCSALQHLDVSYCRGVEGVAGLATALPQLVICREEPEDEEAMDE